MSFLLISAGVLLLSISFLVLTYSLIWCYSTLLSLRQPTENNYQETSVNVTEEEIKDMFNTPSIKRFDERMERMKMELAAVNIPDRGKVVRSGEGVPVKAGVLYEIDDEIVDKYITAKDMEKDEVSN